MSSPSKENLKRLQDTFDELENKQKNVRENLRRLQSAKKEKEAKQIMEGLFDQLKETINKYDEVGRDMEDVFDDIRKNLGRREDGSLRKRPQLTPEEQELTYELKQQLMKNVEQQNERLKSEASLHERMTELKSGHGKRPDDATLSKANSLKLMKMFEKKARDAEVKLKDMQSELSKSQQLAKKYQQLYELEKQKMPTSTTQTPIESSKGDPNDGRLTPRLPNQTSMSFLPPGQRVNDIIRKNEILLEENEALKREIQRLKADNQLLIRKTKHAMSDKDTLLTRLETSEANRKQLVKRLEKEKLQYGQLSRSLTRQASDWIILKKQLAQFDEEYRWSQVGPVNPHGAEQRTHMHQATKNVYMPRKMYPVEMYGSANQTTAQ